MAYFYYLFILTLYLSCGILLWNYVIERQIVMKVWRLHIFQKLNTQLDRSRRRNLIEGVKYGFRYNSTSNLHTKNVPNCVLLVFYPSHNTISYNKLNDRVEYMEWPCKWSKKVPFSFNSQQKIKSNTYKYKPITLFSNKYYRIFQILASR